MSSEDTSLKTAALGTGLTIALSTVTFGLIALTPLWLLGPPYPDLSTDHPTDPVGSNFVDPMLAAYVADGAGWLLIVLAWRRRSSS